MLQKLNTATFLAAVLLASTVGVFMQKPDLGISASNTTELASAINDPSSKELFPEPKENAKLASALADIEAKQAQEEEPKDKQTPEPVLETRVASQDEFYVDTINHKLPPVVEQKASIGDAEIIEMIYKYASLYGANPEVMIGIARCESGLREDAVSSTGAYHGLFQFVTSTWQSNRRAMGLDDSPALMHNAEEAIKTAAFKMGRDGYGAWPVCSQKALNALALNS